MKRRPPRCTCTDTRFHYTALVGSRELALPPPDEHRDDEVMQDAIFEGWLVNFARFRVIGREALHWPRMPRSAIDPPLQVEQPATTAQLESQQIGARLLDRKSTRLNSSH